MNHHTHSDRDHIAQAERNLADAHIQMDIAKIDQLLHSEYTILQPDGRTENKKAVLDSYQKGERKWETAATTDLAVAVYGNLALVSGIWTASGQNGQEPFDYSARFLSMWRKDNGLWQNIAYQSQEIE